MKFGDWVEVSAVLRRKRGNPNTWERQACIPFKAIFLGTRTLWDSKWQNEGPPDYDAYVENTNPTKGVVVCQKNRKPVYVRVEDCKVILNPDIDKLVSGISDILSEYNHFI